ncbi:MAG: hypothetical protein K0S24_1233 [Sphingobacterium sp.]|jgi:hypothetical protein|nr:hypothetical protein [Sphingobacterium sp.]
MDNVTSNPVIGKFRAEFSMDYAGTIYLLILNRISSGYTREELAFLMGQDENYIKDMEELKIPIRNLEVMAHLHWVFNQGKLEIDAFDRRSAYLFEMSIWEEEGVRYYQMEYFINEVETIVFFRLMEAINKDKFRDAETIEIDHHATKLLLMSLLEEGHFKKYCTALQLWRCAEKNIGDGIRVNVLKQELELMLGKKGLAPLRKSKARSFGYRYIQHK